MDQLFEFLKGLFDTNLWPARWHCGQWTTFHGWLYIISDLMIWLAYFLIPVIILNYFSKRKSRLKFEKVYFLFAAFILLCGITHFLDAMMFWVPVYRFNALIRFITAGVSMMTVFYLIKILPEAFKQKTSLELENEIAKRKEAELKLEEANNGLKAFAYVASHDLQEPLRKIRLYTSRLNEVDAVKTDDVSTSFIDKIKTASTKMQNLIEDVLKLSSISVEIDLHAVSVEESVANAKDDLEIKIMEKKAIINCGPIPKVLGNISYLTQLFANLISNSLKFSTNTPIINIKAEKEGNRVIIQFSDNGIGMNQKDTEAIFETFKRLNPKNQYEGSGIGLAICKKIVDIHKGKITVTSKLNEGTTFNIELIASE